MQVIILQYVIFCNLTVTNLTTPFLSGILQKQLERTKQEPEMQHLLKRKPLNRLIRNTKALAHKTRRTALNRIRRFYIRITDRDYSDQFPVF
jgi:hypothetical protein